MKTVAKYQNAMLYQNLVPKSLFCKILLCNAQSLFVLTVDKNFDLRDVKNTKTCIPLCVFTAHDDVAYRSSSLFYYFRCGDWPSLWKCTHPDTCVECPKNLQGCVFAREPSKEHLSTIFFSFCEMFYGFFSENIVKIFVLPLSCINPLKCLLLNFKFV